MVMVGSVPFFKTGQAEALRILMGGEPSPGSFTLLDKIHYFVYIMKSPCRIGAALPAIHYPQNWTK
jgi:hypothetical protein